MAGLALDERLRGALLGAAIGAELSFARARHPERVARRPEDFDALIPQLGPATAPPEPAHWQTDASVIHLVDAGVATYVKQQGRATPEDFGAVFQSHAGIATPALFFDNLHTVQELLLEGMNPRLSGLGNATHGLMCAAMPAVGLYHFAHPEYAYLDGIELASVGQGRLGAEWAGLCAAAIAAAFEPGATPRSVTDTVLGLARENDKAELAKLYWPVRVGREMPDANFAEWWWRDGGYVPVTSEQQFIAWNPPRYLLPLLDHFGTDPERFMAYLTGVDANWFHRQNGMHAATAVVGGAIIGALGGTGIFPARWRIWAEPLCRPWTALLPVVTARVAQEKLIIAQTERLATPAAPAENPLHDKLRACLLAGAIGNAMGSPLENLSYQQIEQRHPGGVRTILEPWRLETEDDNQMAALLTETYTAREGRPVMARHFGKTWAERLNRDEYYVQCMGHACDQIRAGWDARVTGHWLQVTGSAVMCIEPVGLYHLLDPEFAAIDATAISYMYQRGLDITAAAVLAAVVAEAFRDGATVDSICATGLARCPDAPFRTFDRRRFSSPRAYLETCLEIAGRHHDVLAIRPELYDRCLFHHPIEPLEVLGLSLAIFKAADGDVRQACIGGTNLGRDADTIAGRVGMLAGILRGSANIPAEWTQLFRPASLARIDANAAKLAELVAGRKLARLRSRVSQA